MALMTRVASSPEWSSKLLTSMRSFRLKNIFCDTTLETKDGGFFMGHSGVLGSASPFLCQEILLSSTVPYRLAVPMSSHILAHALEYMYIGKWSDIPDADLKEVSEAASLFGLQSPAPEVTQCSLKISSYTSLEIDRVLNGSGVGNLGNFGNLWNTPGAGEQQMSAPDGGAALAASSQANSTGEVWPKLGVSAAVSQAENVNYHSGSNSMNTAATAEGSYSNSSANLYGDMGASYTNAGASYTNATASYHGYTNADARYTNPGAIYTDAGATYTSLLGPNGTTMGANYHESSASCSRPRNHCDGTTTGRAPVISLHGTGTRAALPRTQPYTDAFLPTQQAPVGSGSHSRRTNQKRVSAAQWSNSEEADCHSPARKMPSMKTKALRKAASAEFKNFLPKKHTKTPICSGPEVRQPKKSKANPKKNPKKCSFPGKVHDHDDLPPVLSPERVPCRFCPKTYANKHSRRRHELLLHPGQKPGRAVAPPEGKKVAKVKLYQCGSCDSVLRGKHNLQVHNRIHTGEKPYKCGYCGLEFRYKTSMVNHVRRLHVSHADVTDGLHDESAPEYESSSEEFDED